MIDLFREYFEHWNLFGSAWLSGWLVAIVLAQVGVLVVARDQIFIGAAVSQASTLGIALSLAFASWLAVEVEPTEIDPYAFDPYGGVEEVDDTPASLPYMSIGFAVAAALLTARGGGAPGRESHESITGWVFLFCASFSILVVAKSDHGSEEVHRVLFSSLLGAGSVDVVVFAVAAFISVLICVFAFSRRRLLLLTLDPTMAAAVGMRVTAWSLGIAAWLGLTIGLSMRVAGLLYTFGCLVLPALIAKSLHREVSPLFVTAPAIALAATVPGFALAHRLDLPPAQLAVAILSGFVVLAWAASFLRRRFSRT